MRVKALFILSRFLQSSLLYYDLIERSDSFHYCREAVKNKFTIELCFSDRDDAITVTCRESYRLSHCAIFLASSCSPRIAEKSRITLQNGLEKILQVLFRKK